MRGFILIAGLLGASFAAEGAISYQYVTDSELYGVGSDGKVAIKVYLQETTTTTSLITSENGLVGAAFEIVPISGTGVRIISGTPGAGLMGDLEVQASGQAIRTIMMATSFTTGPKPVAGKVELGTVSFEAMSPTANFRFAVRPYGSGNTITWTSAYDLDVSTADAMVSYTGASAAAVHEFVIAVPEPVSAMFAGMVGVLVCRRPSKRDRE